ncbi:hypothetical protein NC797_16610, partial [Aquibacillus sp. 3ASR75-11]
NFHSPLKYAIYQHLLHSILPFLAYLGLVFYQIISKNFLLFSAVGFLSIHSSCGKCFFIKILSTTFIDK